MTNENQNITKDETDIEHLLTNTYSVFLLYKTSLGEEENHVCVLLETKLALDKGLEKVYWFTLVYFSSMAN